MYKKFFSMFLLLFLFVANFTISSFADVAVGDSIISFGADLSESEKDSIFKEFNPPENVQEIVTTNAEEHKYLGGVVPNSKIGNFAISSVMITYTEKGSGLKVDTSDKITYITDESYINALITAGVEDADIKVTSPRNASGTAALTGIMKAYEVSSGEVIDDSIKKAANEEMIRTVEIGKVIGNDQAVELFNKIKQEIAKQNPKTTEEVRDIIINIVNNYNINLTDEQIEQLVSLFDKMRSLDIDWNRVSNQIEDIGNKATEFLSSEEGKGFLENLRLFFKALLEWLTP